MGIADDGFVKREIKLSAGTVHYRERGEGDPLVFVHGFGANGRLWDATAATLAPEHRCIVPDWPLGSHSEPMNESADLTPPGIAALISEFLVALDLNDVTIVGNDSGGAVSQILVTEMPARIGRLVLTNCDCFEKFPPAHFKAMAAFCRTPGAAKVLAQSMRSERLRRSPLAYGALTESPMDAELLEAFAGPQLADPAIGRDGVKFFGSVDKRYTLAAAEKLRDLSIPVLLAWGDADRFFTVDDARRLADLIPDSTLVPIAGGRTFVPIDRPAELATAIATFLVREPA
nr:alpha/beta hydrolase [Solirubrobacterales bacterium]